VFENVVIGIDGREGGRDAIALAKRLAAPGASFTMAHVCGGGPVAWLAHQLGEERGFDREASMLAAERDRAGMAASIAYVAGMPPARGLHALARARSADLIVVGSSRHGLLGRLLLGDDAGASLVGAPCAVAIASRGYRESVDPPVDSGVGNEARPLATAGV
jgi:nucleotide-binding universal stress UspA family protein